MITTECRGEEEDCVGVLVVELVKVAAVVLLDELDIVVLLVGVVVYPTGVAAAPVLLNVVLVVLVALVLVVDTGAAIGEATIVLPHEAA